MADAEKTSWADYRPSKKVWFWSMAGACVATMIVGWTTSGSARTMTALAVRDARAELAADICVHNFATAVDAQATFKLYAISRPGHAKALSMKVDGRRLPASKNPLSTLRMYAPNS